MQPNEIRKADVRRLALIGTSETALPAQKDDFIFQQEKNESYYPKLSFTK